jgi:hypothetical protein
MIVISRVASASLKDRDPSKENLHYTNQIANP